MIVIDNRIIRLRSQGYNNEVVLAILSTEMHFRPLGLRLLEYLTLGFFGHARTIGIGQIHIKHWNKRGYYGFDAILAALSPERNYKICEELIFQDSRNRTFKEKLTVYTGEVTQSYYRTFSIYLELLSSKKSANIRLIG